jgi:tellurite resistance protein TehA-like permease
MPQETFIEKQEENIAIHIFSVSAAMVGVCLTVIGILNIIAAFRKIETLSDEVTAVDAVVFLGSCIISYVAIKTKTRKRRLLLEKIADGIFLTGLALMVVVCLFIVYKLI